jgi:hypothetical protein
VPVPLKPFHTSQRRFCWDGWFKTEDTIKKITETTGEFHHNKIPTTFVCKANPKKK